MYDWVKIEYPLAIKGANEIDYQTKNTPEQCYERYKIDRYGRLWWQECKYEWVDKDKLKSVDKKWVRIKDFSGEVNLVGPLKGEDGYTGVDWCFVFANGKMISFKRLGV